MNLDWKGADSTTNKKMWVVKVQCPLTYTSKKSTTSAENISMEIAGDIRDTRKKKEQKNTSTTDLPLLECTRQI